MAQCDANFESLKALLQVMRDDPVINEKILSLLKLDSYQRRFILNNWLEQLRKQHAYEELSQALACLFDDIIAEKVFKIISQDPV